MKSERRLETFQILSEKIYRFKKRQTHSIDIAEQRIILPLYLFSKSVVQIQKYYWLINIPGLQQHLISIIKALCATLFETAFKVLNSS